MDNQNFYFYFYPNNESHVLNIMKGDELIRQFNNVNHYFNQNNEIKTVNDCLSLWKSFGGSSYGILKKVPFTQNDLENLFLKLKIVPQVNIIHYIIKHYFSKYDKVWEIYVEGLILKYFFDNNTHFKDQEFSYLTKYNDKIRNCSIILKELKGFDDVGHYIRKIIKDEKLLSVHTNKVIPNKMDKVDVNGELYRIQNGTLSPKWLI